MFCRMMQMPQKPSALSASKCIELVATTLGVVTSAGARAIRIFRKEAGARTLRQGVAIVTGERDKVLKLVSAYLRQIFKSMDANEAVCALTGGCAESRCSNGSAIFSLTDRVEGQLANIAAILSALGPSSKGSAKSQAGTLPWDGADIRHRVGC